MAHKGKLKEREETLFIRTVVRTLEDKDHKEILIPMLQLNDQAYTSMCQDILAKRKTEVAIFGETVIQLGLKYHVATPVNQVLVNMIHAIEAGF